MRRLGLPRGAALQLGVGFAFDWAIARSAWTLGRGIRRC